MALNDVLTPKQGQVLHAYLTVPHSMIVLNGAVRAGKTRINNIIFLYELKRVAKQAKESGDRHPIYILAGASSGSIHNNVVLELLRQFGLDLKPDKHGHYHLFGVDIVPVYTKSIAGLARARGFTAYGAYVNEATLANEAVFNEIRNRCSMPGSHIIVDTNPDIPTHWLKRDFIDNHDPAAGIISFNFTIDDNTFLDPQYVKRMKAATPKGMFYDRNIRGLWVTGDGIVYENFDKERMTITPDQIPEGLSIYAGVDWGFEHLNSIGVFGEDSEGNVYFLEEHTGKGKYISHWVDVAKDIQSRYGDIVFACDSARPDNINEFLGAGINAVNANKQVLPGIECVSKYMASGKFFVNGAGVDHFYDEIYQYIWNEKTGEPVKEHDDVMDMMRYAIYTRHAKGGYVPWT